MCGMCLPVCVYCDMYGVVLWCGTGGAGPERVAALGMLQHGLRQRRAQQQQADRVNGSKAGPRSSSSWLVAQMRREVELDCEEEGEEERGGSGDGLEPGGDASAYSAWAMEAVFDEGRRRLRLGLGLGQRRGGGRGEDGGGDGGVGEEGGDGGCARSGIESMCSSSGGSSSDSGKARSSCECSYPASSSEEEDSMAAVPAGSAHGSPAGSRGLDGGGRDTPAGSRGLGGGGRDTPAGSRLRAAQQQGQQQQQHGISRAPLLSSFGRRPRLAPMAASLRPAASPSTSEGEKGEEEVKEELRIGR